MHLGVYFWAVSSVPLGQIFFWNFPFQYHIVVIVLYNKCWYLVRQSSHFVLNPREFLGNSWAFICKVFRMSFSSNLKNGWNLIKTVLNSKIILGKIDALQNSAFFVPVIVQSQKQNQQEIFIERFIARNRLIPLWGWLGKSKSLKQAMRKGRQAFLDTVKLLSADGISSSSAKSQLCSKSFQLIESGPSRLFWIISLT